MSDNFIIVYKGGEGEISEKKSRFIATISPVNSEEEAIEFVESMKKKYWNARHNCYAFVLGDNNEIQRFSDDGEPSGTAGKPILEVLLGNNIHNAVAVVTRYFGGTLLGTGGLIRAYQKSVNAGLENCELIEKYKGQLLEITTDYNGLGKIQYIAEKIDAHIIDTEYTENVLIKAVINVNSKENFINSITEATNANATIEEKDQVGYGIKDNKCIPL